jgi:Uma2 family endonuclease
MSLAEKPGQSRMTVSDFLELPSHGQIGKRELVHGVVRAMAPPSPTHGVLQARIAGRIDAHLTKRKSPCRVGTEVGVIPIWDPKHNLRQPDITVTCKPATRGERTFPDPILIIQILSPSNEQDTWESIQACATIASLTEIVVVAFDAIRMSIFRRGPNGVWPEVPETVETGGCVHLASIDATFDIDEIFAGTVLE